MIIKVLGPGCGNCKTLEKQARQAVIELGIQAEIVKVEDIIKILEYKILRTPALVIDEKVVIDGRVPSALEVKEIIQQYI